MNNLRFFVFWLTWVSFAAFNVVCYAGEDDKQHYDVTEVSKQLAIAMTSRYSKLSEVGQSLCTTPKRLITTGGVILRDITYFSPYQELGYEVLSAKNNGEIPWGYALTLMIGLVVPFLNPFIVLLCSEGPWCYQEYIRRRVSLVDFTSKVECLQKVLRKENDEEGRRLAEMSTWFLEKGYDEANEIIMHNFFHNLEQRSQRVNS